MPAVRGAEAPPTDAETARTQQLPRVAVPADASARQQTREPEQSAPASRRPPPHPASVRPRQRTSGGRYSLSPVAEEVLVAASKPPSVSPPAATAAAATGKTDERAVRRIRARQATPAQRPHARRSSPPPALPGSNGSAARTSATVSAPPPPPAPRASTPPPAPRSSTPPPAPRSSTPPPAPQTQVYAVAPSAPPRVPRPIPASREIPIPVRGPEPGESLPSVVLDPELEARAQRRSSAPPAPAGRARLGSDDAETALIPRALLDGPDGAERPVGAVRASRQAWLGLLTVGAVAAALVTLAAHLKQRDDAQAQATPPSSSTSVVANAAPTAPLEPVPDSHRRIRVESQPSGAHVVFRGAVVGTTPTEVPAPEGDELFLLRLPGHQTQLLQLSSASDPRILVVMQAELAQASADAPAKPAR